MTKYLAERINKINFVFQSSFKPFIMKNQRLFILLSSAVMLLIIPFIAMQFTNEVDWDIFDFTIMGILLSATALASELVLRKVKSKKNRILICGAILFVFFLTWAELAVGIFGSPFAGS